MKHSERKHALLSASGSERWLNCTPSALAEEEESKNGAKDTSSVYADEGTLAHELAELSLKIASYTGDQKGKKKLQRERAEKVKHELYFPGMEDYIEQYVDFVLSEWVELKKDRSAKLGYETRVDFSHIVPEGFGSVDSFIASDSVLPVFDFKFGAGVEVSAVDNSQLRLYALGLAEKLSLVYDFKKVKITIIQPRLNNFSTEILTLDELEKWGESIKPIAQKAFAGEGERKAGDWCRFCSLKTSCKALAERNLNVARMTFNDPYPILDPDKLTVEEYSYVYKHASSIKSWLEAVTSLMVEEAQKGIKFPGLKLVNGRSRRSISDEEKAADRILTDYDDISRKDLFNVKLIGITDLEKRIGKKAFNEKLSDLIIMTGGAPTLAPLDDKRQEIGLAKAQKDFEDEINFEE